MKWLSVGWWVYLFSSPWPRYAGPWWLLWSKFYTPRWEIVWCRIKGHPNGRIHFNPGGLEPDNHCKDCGEDLG
jgi:hypothetical protein